MKFITLDSSGEMEPLELLLTPVSTSGDSAMGEIPVVGLDSNSPLPDLDSMPVQPPVSSGIATSTSEDVAKPESVEVLRHGEFWLEGDSILCACPDCSAPMSIRLAPAYSHSDQVRSTKSEIRNKSKARMSKNGQSSSVLDI